MALNELRSHPRLIRKLQQSFGDTLCAAMDDPSVIEIMLNPDGQIFIERIGSPMSEMGSLAAHEAEVIVGTVAHALRLEIDADRPIISGELPMGGHRFEGLLPPVVAAATFTIRRRAQRQIPLSDYVGSGVMSSLQAADIRKAVLDRRNIIVAGGTGSGKTTLANAIIDEIAAVAPHDRLVILEDTAEIRCKAANVVTLHTSDGVDMRRLLMSTMRLRPDRIVIGEVRDGAALTLLKAWNTGHPGGVATIHANSALSALRRLEQLTAEVSQQMLHDVIADAVDLVISIERTPHGRIVRELLHVNAFAAGRYVTMPEEEARHVA